MVRFGELHWNIGVRSPQLCFRLQHRQSMSSSVSACLVALVLPLLTSRRRLELNEGLLSRMECLSICLPSARVEEFRHYMKGLPSLHTWTQLHTRIYSLFWATDNGSTWTCSLFASLVLSVQSNTVSNQVIGHYKSCFDCFSFAVISGIWYLQTFLRRGTLSHIVYSRSLFGIHSTPPRYEFIYRPLGFVDENRPARVFSSGFLFAPGQGCR